MIFKILSMLNYVRGCYSFGIIVSGVIADLVVILMPDPDTVISFDQEVRTT